MTTVITINNAWVDAQDPDAGSKWPYRALSPRFMTVIALSDNLTDLVFALQTAAYASAAMAARTDGKPLVGVDFGASEIELGMPGADQPIGVCELTMRMRFKGELSRTEPVALLPFVPWDDFAQAMGAAGARRSLQTSADAARRLQL